MAVLVLDNVTKTYGEGRGAVTALEHASISVETGELIAIVGPSGSGKTTMLSIAGALLHPTSGKVHVNGVDVASLGSKQMADLRLREIGFVLQSSNVIPFLRARPGERHQLPRREEQQGGTRPSRRAAGPARTRGP